jgi:peptidyl-prolyl cis-trans isomerase C
MVKPDQQDKRNEMLFKGAVDNLTIVTLLKAEAKKQNVVVDKAKADEQYAMISKQEDFPKVLALRGITEAEARKSIEESLAAQEILDRAALNLPEPSDADIQKIYEKTSFAVPERARLAQLFLKADPASTPDQKAEIRKKLESIRADIESKKITFAEAADKYSQDPNGAPKGGDIGLIARTQVSVKALEEAIFSAAPGTMTPVIEGPQGFHLVYVTEIKPAGVRSLEEVKPMLRQQVKLAARQAALRKYVDELKSNASIETFMTAEEFEKRHPSE